jgi:23S rRNA (uridine2552-2'-O)-methyltransferase
MCLGTVFFALGGGEFYLRHGTIIVYRLSESQKSIFMGIKVKTQSKKVNKAWLNQHVNDP